MTSSSWQWWVQHFIEHDGVNMLLNISISNSLHSTIPNFLKPCRVTLLGISATKVVQAKIPVSYRQPGNLTSREIGICRKMQEPFHLFLNFI